MKPTAQCNKANISPRKARLPANLIRGKQVHRACHILKHTPHKASPLLHKLLLNAVNNWQQKNTSQSRTSKENLYVKQIFVNGGKMLKRIQPAPQGRAHRIRKRSAHISVLLDAILPTQPTSTEEKTSKHIAKKDANLVPKEKVSAQPTAPATKKEKPSAQSRQKISANRTK